MKYRLGGEEKAGPASRGAHPPSTKLGRIIPRLSPTFSSPHLILTGFMGSGKTTVGKILASRLALPFVDLDDDFTQQTGLSPQFYIPRFKETAFRKLEKIYLQHALANSPSVLATGGGSVLDPWNRRRMLQKGYVIWLELPPRILWQRLLQTRNRPLLPRNCSFVRFQKFYQRRLPFYHACHFRFRCGTASPEAVAISILKHYKTQQHAPRAFE